MGLLLTLDGCGGGSAGTGIGTETRSLTIEGTLVSETNKPLAGVTVTILETGDSSVTNTAGQFTITTDPFEGDTTLEYQRGKKRGSTIISAQQDSGAIQIVLKVNPLFDEVTADSLVVDSRIVGRCESYFENKTPIRQSNRVPSGTRCVAKARVLTGTTPLAHAPIAIQYRACEADSPWITVTLGETLSGANIGVGQV